jgi:hypothetical protein
VADGQGGTDLAVLQEHVRQLLRAPHSVVAEDDAYLRALAQSPQLALVREIVAQWRSYDLRRTCVLTSRLLTRAGQFEVAVEAFTRHGASSPFVEELGAAFLAALEGHADPLVATVARFERHLLHVARGDPGEYAVAWDRDPHVVLRQLVAAASEVEEAPRGCYRTLIARRYPGYFVVHQQTGIEEDP